MNLSIYNFTTKMIQLVISNDSTRHRRVQCVLYFQIRIKIALILIEYEIPVKIMQSLFFILWWTNYKTIP